MSQETSKKHCDSGHSDVWFQSDECPLCHYREIMEEQRAALFVEIRDLEAKLK